MTTAALRTLAVAADKRGLAELAARYVSELSAAAVAARGRFVVSLAGGSTPRDLYARLAAAPYRDAIAWERWEVLFGDERCVPPTDAESNYRMADETLLSRVPLRAESIHRVAGEATDPHSAASAYDALLKARFVPPGGLFPAIDLSLLGMGDDGHTASLFPDVIDECMDPSRHAVAVQPAAKPTWRVTLSFRSLAAADHTLFLIAGAGKREMLRRVLQGDSTLPAARVAAAARRVAFLVDAAAGGA